MADLNSGLNATSSVAQSATTKTSVAIDAMTAKVLNSFNEKLEIEKNNWFANAHGDPDNYNKSDYTRVAFKSETAAKQFMQSMREQGIKAVAPTFRINGQYLCEIPKNNENGITSTSLIEDFNATYDFKTYDEKTYQKAVEQSCTDYIHEHYNDHSTSQAIAGFMQANIWNEMDELGTVIGKVTALTQMAQQAENKIANYKPHSNYGLFSNTEIFDTRLTPDGKSQLGRGNDATLLNHGHQKVATVIGGNTVIIDGKICKDQKIIDSVLKQHKKRVEIAEKYASKTPDKHGNFTADVGNRLKTRHNNAQAILENIYRQEYAVTVNSKDTDTFQTEGSFICSWEMGGLEAISNTLNTDKFEKDARKTQIANEKYEEITKKLNSPDFATSMEGKKIKDEIDNELAKVKAVDSEAKLSDFLEGGKYADRLSKSAREALKLSILETNLLEGRPTIHNDVSKTSWLKDIDFKKGDMSPEKLMEMNKRFFEIATKRGYSFVTITGQFDVKAMQKLSAHDLHRLELTPELRDLFIKINQKGTFGGDSMLKKTLKVGMKTLGAGKAVLVGVKGLGMKGMNFAMKYGDNPEAYNDINQLTRAYNTGTKVAKTTVNVTQKTVKTTVKTVQRISRSRLKDLAKLHKANRHSDTVKNLTGNTDKLKAPKKSERLNDRLSEYAAARQAKFAAKQQAKFDKVIKKQNSAFGKINRRLQKMRSTIANNPVVKKLKAIIAAPFKALAAVAQFKQKAMALAGGLVLKLGFFLQIAIVIVTVIIALVDLLSGIFNIGNWFAPRSYKDTVAYNLYLSLLDQENKFVMELANATSAEECLVDSNGNYIGYDALRLGYWGLRPEVYCAGNLRLEYVSANNTAVDGHYEQGTIAINPFWRIKQIVGFDYNSNPEAYTLCKNFDGEHTYEISTNLNDYSIIDLRKDTRFEADYDNAEQSDKNWIYYGVNNGHTSNIKDIIAMTDVMYQMEASEGDEELKNIMGMSPAQLDYESGAGRVFKVIGEWFVNLWEWITEGDNNWDYPTLENNAVSWNTVHNYAFTLFQTSHQEFLYLKPQYCDENLVVKDSEGNELNISTETKAALGMCPSLHEADFELNLYPARFDPDDAGEPQPTLCGYFLHLTEEEINLLHGSPNCIANDVQITMDKLSSSTNPPCLWDNMPSYNTVVECLGVQHHYATTSSSFWDAASTTTCWKDSMGSPSDIPLVELTGTGSGSATHIVTTVNGSVSSETGGTAEDAYNQAYENALQNLLDSKEFDDPFDFYKVQEGYMAFLDYNVYPFEPYEVTKNAEVNSQSYTHPKPPKPTNMPPEATWNPPTVVTTTITYTCTITLRTKWYDGKTYSRYRECEGHTFVYCGGHLATHQQGNVFSMTNAQLALSDIYEKGDEPSAIYKDLNSHGTYDAYGNDYTNSFKTTTSTAESEFQQRYPEIIGKVPKIDYSKCTQYVTDGDGKSYPVASYAANYGGCQLPLENTGSIFQGSAVSHGLNIIVDESSGASVWGTGKQIEIPQSNYNPNAVIDGAMYEGLQVGDGTYENAVALIRQCRDIFDCDVIINKGRNILPYKDFTKYEGWTADNMILALNRVSMEWVDVYGFDINLEIGETNVELSPTDVEVLVYGLQQEYGESIMNEGRTNLVESILSWVGRGFATDQHHPPSTTNVGSADLCNRNHGFLTTLCHATGVIKVIDEEGNEQDTKMWNFSDSCTSGTDGDAASYMYNLAVRKKGNNSAKIWGSFQDYANEEITSLGNLKPTNIIVHKAVYEDGLPTTDEIVLPDAFAAASVDGGAVVLNGYDLRDYYINEQEVIYLGTFSYSTVCKMLEYLKDKLSDEEFNGFKDEASGTKYHGYNIEGNALSATSKGIALSTGQLIYSGVPITIDMSKMGIYSAFKLRTGNQFVFNQSTNTYDSASSGNYSDKLAKYIASYETGGKEKNDKMQANKALNAIYYWVANIDKDSRTYKFEIPIP